MFAIERGVVIGAACLRGIIRRVEPKSKMVDLHRIGRYAGGRFRDDGGRGRKSIGRRCFWDARRDNEGLLVEAPDKIAHAYAELIRIDVAQIPGKAKWLVWHFDIEKIEAGIWRQTKDLHFHIFERPKSMDGDPTVRVGQAGLGGR